MGKQVSSGAADEAAKKAKAEADAAKQKAAEADQKAAAEKAAADAEKSAKKGHTHRVNWSLWRDRKHHKEGATIALSDEEADKLGDVVTKL